MAVLLTVLGLFLVTSCGQQKDPTDFNDQTKASFIGTCSGTSTDPNATDNSTNAAKDSAADTDSGSGGQVKLGTKPVCTCVYGKLVKGGFKEFKKINDNLINNPNQTLPEPVLGYVNDCLKSASSTTTKSGSSTTTTAPGAGGSTTTTAPADTGSSASS